MHRHTQVLASASEWFGFSSHSHTLTHSIFHALKMPLTFHRKTLKSSYRLKLPLATTNHPSVLSGSFYLISSTMTNSNDICHFSSTPPCTPPLFSTYTPSLPHFCGSSSIVQPPKLSADQNLKHTPILTIGIISWQLGAKVKQTRTLLPLFWSQKSI